MQGTEAVTMSTCNRNQSDLTDKDDRNFFSQLWTYFLSDNVSINIVRLQGK